MYELCTEGMEVQMFLQLLKNVRGRVSTWTDSAFNVFTVK